MHSNLRFVAELPGGIGQPLSPKMDHLICFLPGTITLGATGGLTVAKAKKSPGGWSAPKEQQMSLAKELMKTCWGMAKVTVTGIAPETAWFNADQSALQPNPGTRSLPNSGNSLASWKKDYIIKPLDAHSLQRPETVESLIMVWRITQDPIYRKWGWEIFKNLKKYTILEDGEGYTSLNDVNILPLTQRDNMESFWPVSLSSRHLS